jgi:hypothetical protein
MTTIKMNFVAFSSIVTFVHNLKRFINYFCILAIKIAFPGLKNRKFHIVCARILLICFIAGQYMVYAHQHLVYKNSGKSYDICKHQPRETVTEKCSICDAMHHTSMVNHATIFFNELTAIGHVFKTFDYNFKSISLINSGGRAPPVLNYLS